MIGQRANMTLWRCTFRFRKQDESKAWVPQVGQRLLVTADPTGGDLLDVARLLALGPKPHDGHEFTLTESARIDDITGLVQLVSNDYAWTAGTSAIEELAKVTAERDQLKRQLEEIDAHEERQNREWREA